MANAHHELRSGRTPDSTHVQSVSQDVLVSEPSLPPEVLRRAVQHCKQLLISPDAFTDWLRTLPRRSACGRAGSGEASPLAHFLSEQSGRHVRVGRQEALICGALADDTALARYRSEASVALPGWAQRVEWGMQYVTAARALEVVALVRSGAYKSQRASSSLSNA